MRASSLKLTTILVALVLSSFTAHANSEVQNSIDKHVIGAGGVIGDETLAQLRYGYNFNERYRFEVEASTGERNFDSDSSNLFTLFAFDDDIDIRMMGFAVVRFPFGIDNSAVFVRGGAGMSRVSAYESSSFSPETFNGAVVAAGTGIEIFFTRMVLRLETNITKDTAFDKISDGERRDPRDDYAVTLAASIMVRF